MKKSILFEIWRDWKFSFYFFSLFLCVILYFDYINYKSYYINLNKVNGYVTEAYLKSMSSGSGRSGGTYLIIGYDYINKGRKYHETESRQLSSIQGDYSSQKNIDFLKKFQENKNVVVYIPMKPFTATVFYDNKRFVDYFFNTILLIFCVLLIFVFLILNKINSKKKS